MHSTAIISPATIISPIKKDKIIKAITRPLVFLFVLHRTFKRIDTTRPDIPIAKQYIVAKLNIFFPYDKSPFFIKLEIVL